METSLTEDIPPFIGADLTDRYSPSCRPISVCGMRPYGNRIKAKFWIWTWTPGPADLSPNGIKQELIKTQVVLLDGPQGVATAGRKMRDSERQLCTQAKTGDTRNTLRDFCKGFVESSLDLFDVILRNKIIDPLTRDNRRGIGECYPGHTWKLLAKQYGKKLVKKDCLEGRKARFCLLRDAFDVDFEPEFGNNSPPSHDQLDAALGALLAVAVGKGVEGVDPVFFGEQLKLVKKEYLVEGQIVSVGAKGGTEVRKSQRLRLFE